MSLYAFDATVAAAVQQGILKLKFESAMDSKLAFSAFTYKEMLDANLGDEKTFTKNGRLAVDLTPRAATDAASNLDNGMTVRKAGIEQFTVKVDEWDALDYVNLFQNEAMIASDLVRQVGNFGINAAQTKERLVRKAYLDFYLGGNTRVLASGTLSATTCRVDDIRGFQKVLTAGGKLVSVDGSNTLLVDQYDTSGTLIQTLTVTGVAADSNVSSLLANSLGGFSGQITYSTATIPTAGHALLAQNAPKVFRAGGRVHSALIGAGDIATLDLAADATTYLKNQGNDGYRDGYIYCLASPSSLRQLRKDPQFQLAYQGRGDSDEVIKRGKIFEHDGIRYVETNEVPISPGSTGVNVHRMLFVADPEACMEADWQGFNNYIDQAQGSSLHYVEKIQSNIALILRDPIDVKRRMQPLAWSMCTGFTCGSDMRANSDIIPTASNSMYKKALWVEHAA